MSGSARLVKLTALMMSVLVAFGQFSPSVFAAGHLRPQAIDQSPMLRAQLARDLTNEWLPSLRAALPAVVAVLAMIPQRVTYHLDLSRFFSGSLPDGFVTQIKSELDQRVASGLLASDTITPNGHYLDVNIAYRGPRTVTIERPIIELIWQNLHAGSDATLAGAASGVLVGSTSEQGIVRGWETLGGPGEELGKMASPRGIAVDPLGRVWVADSAHNRIQVYDSGDRSWDAAGTLGLNALPGQLMFPNGLAVDSQRRIVWVVDTEQHRIQSYVPATQQWDVIGGAGAPVPGRGPGEFFSPTGIAVDAQGHVWVADTGNHRIQMYNPATNLWRTFGAEGVRTREHEASPGEFQVPRGVALDAGGGVWVTDSGNGRLQRYDSRAHAWSVIGRRGSGIGELSSPFGVTVDARGWVWVADTGNHRIAIYDPSTNRWAAFGEQGIEPGQFESPMGVAIHSITVEEIAVSVVAELVAVRRGAQNPNSLSVTNGLADKMAR